MEAVYAGNFEMTNKPASKAATVSDI